MRRDPNISYSMEKSHWKSRDDRQYSWRHGIARNIYSDIEQEEPIYSRYEVEANRVLSRGPIDHIFLSKAQAKYLVWWDTVYSFSAWDLRRGDIPFRSAIPLQRGILCNTHYNKGAPIKSRVRNVPIWDIVLRFEDVQ